MLWVSSFQLQWTGFKQPCSKTKPLSNISIPLLFQFEWNPKIMNEPLHRGTSFMCTEYDKPACFRTKPKSLHGIYHVFCSFTLAILLLNIFSYNDTTYRNKTDSVLRKNTLIYVHVYIKWHVMWINFQRQQKRHVITKRQLIKCIYIMTHGRIVPISSIPWRGGAGSASDSWSVDTCQSWREFEPHQRPPVVSLSKKMYPHCLLLVGSRNGFQRDLHTHKNCLFHNRIKIS